MGYTFVSNGKGTIQVSGATSIFMVTMRKIMLTEVLTIAMSYDPFDSSEQDVRISYNTGCLHNELLSHRISLVPLMITRDEMQNIDVTKVVIELDVEADKVPRDVTSKDFRIMIDGVRKEKLEKKWFPPDEKSGEHILITRLRPDQKERITGSCRIRKGCGKMHARWSPVSRCSYQLIAKDQFRVDIESCCGLTPVEIYTDALYILRDKIETASPAFSEDESGNIAIFRGENSTMGCFVTETILEYWPDEFEFIGCVQPHPLADEVRIRFRVKDGSATSVFENTMKKIGKMIDDILRHAPKKLASSFEKSSAAKDLEESPGE